MPFRPNVQAGQGSNPLWMNVAVAHSRFAHDGEQWEGKNLLLDLIVVTPVYLQILPKRSRMPRRLRRL